jgi:hypothetical protein
MSTRFIFSADYEKEMMPMDVIRQDMGPLTDVPNSLFKFCVPPLEIADYMDHYFPRT